MKKIALISLLVLFISFTVTNQTVYAAGTYNIKIEPSSKEIKAGNIVTVSFTLSDITIAEGIGAISGKLEYDKGIFEKVTSSDINSGAGWASIIYNDQNQSEGKFAVERQSGYNIKTDNLLFSVTFKSLSNAKLGDTKIQLSELSVSDGDNDYELETKSATIKIAQQTTNSQTTNNETKDENKSDTKPEDTKPAETKTEQTKPEEQKVTNNNISNGTDKSKDNSKATSEKQQNSVQNSNSTNNTVLPYAGNNNLIFVLILVIIGIGIAAYIQCKKLKNI